MEVINSADTAWIMVAAALVMLMTPGLAFFYGGMVRRKNVLGVLMQCFIALCVMTLWWVTIGYSLAFSPGNKFIGGLDWVLLNGVGLAPSPDYGSTIPHQLFMIFQGMFAIITPALIIGAFVERMKFSAFIIFSLLWGTLVYAPVCHWVWSTNAWMADLGALDFAGGAVVHINAGVAALATALIIGRRTGYTDQPVKLHHIPLTVLGAGLLWFGWFGFNAGSALAADALAVNAFVVTHVAAAAGGLSWALLEWKHNGSPTMFGTVTGIVAGLVAITPAAGFVDVGGAIWIGLLVSVFCFIAVGIIKPKLGYDDSLDAFGVHGIGGIWGALATGIFATTAVNPGGADGLLNGNPEQLWIQFITVVATLAYSFIVSFIIYKVIDKIMGVRVAEHEEAIGLDLTQHHEEAYSVL